VNTPEAAEEALQWFMNREGSDGLQGHRFDMGGDELRNLLKTKGLDRDKMKQRMTEVVQSPTAAQFGAKMASTQAGYPEAPCDAKKRKQTKTDNQGRLPDAMNKHAYSYPTAPQRSTTMPIRTGGGAFQQSGAGRPAPNPGILTSAKQVDQKPASTTPTLPKADAAEKTAMNQYAINFGAAMAKEAGWKSELGGSMLNPLSVFGGNLGGTIAAAVTPTRTNDEMAKQDNDVWKNLLIPGYGHYNTLKRQGHSYWGSEMRDRAKELKEEEKAKGKGPQPGTPEFEEALAKHLGMEGKTAAAFGAMMAKQAIAEGQPGSHYASSAPAGDTTQYITPRTTPHKPYQVPKAIMTQAGQTYDARQAMTPQRRAHIEAQNKRMAASYDDGRHRQLDTGFYVDGTGTVHYPKVPGQQADDVGTAKPTAPTTPTAGAKVAPTKPGGGLRPGEVGEQIGGAAANKIIPKSSPLSQYFN
jgi:hypothetical protein